MSKYQTEKQFLGAGKVYQHGKTQIPRDVRRKLGLTEGSHIIWWWLEEGKILIEKPKV